jgi:two-component system chemotaxis response regulator CheB
VASSGKTRVLVVDDSALMRRVICNLLEDDKGIEVVGTAKDGLDAIKKIEELKPEVVTLDVQMPKLDGLQTLGYIMAECPVPCVMLSAYTPKGADITLRALEYGATDFVLKPSGAISLNLDHVQEELVQKVKVARGIDLRRLPFIHNESALDPKRIAVEGRQSRRARRAGVVIGCSTGGPRALSQVLPGLPADFPVPVLVAQHMSAGFTRSLAARLDRESAITVKEAEDGEDLNTGTVYLAPGDWHMEVIAAGTGARISLNQKPPVLGVRPSVDMLFTSAAAAFGSECLGVILTGMGHDGAKGVRALKEARGSILAQDEASSVVFGMPRAARDTGLVDEVVALQGIAQAIKERRP